ncbi:AHH domain-containing protein [Bacillus pacificus]|uniref:AHH domain-containing protein n=1 Tax=Bacillus anthracis TaxID=1392 RepID=UPI001E5B2973|nr:MULTISPECIES: AHH domain-containing protein [Bacillus cereus group]MCC0767797.1 AHH domain-containing protein [Bacillus pacificus]
MYCVGFIPFNFVLASVKVPVYRTNDNGTLERVGTNVEGWVHGHCIDSNQKIQDEIDSVRASLAEIRGSGGTKGTGEGSRIIPGTPGIVTGGNSTKLGKNMMTEMGLRRSTKWSGYQAQHIIPSEMADNPVIKKIGMNFDDSSNGIFLRVPDDNISTMARHRGYHSVYNEVVARALNKMDINQSIDSLQKQVYDLQKI